MTWGHESTFYRKNTQLVYLHVISLCHYMSLCMSWKIIYVYMYRYCIPICRKFSMFVFYKLVPSACPRNRGLGTPGWFFRSSFGGCFFFSPFLDAKRWDECDLAGFFTDIILSKQVSQFITHFFKKQLLADKLRMSGGKKKHWLDSFWISKCDVKFIGFCEWTMFSF